MMSGILTSLGEALKAAGDRLGAGPSFSAGERACVVLIDRNGRLCGMSGPARAAFRAHGSAAFLPLLFLPEERPRLEAAIASPAVGRISARARAADGRVGVYELIFQRRRDGRIAVLVSDRSADDAARRALERETAAAAAEAKATARILADLSHEMKTPLNAVIGFAEAMREETFGPVGHPKYEEYADHIRASGRHLLDLVTSILDLARLEADRLALKPVMCAPGAIVAECAEMVRMTADKAGLSLDIEIAEDIGECLIDPRALRQIAINLLSNAVKFTSDGAVTVRLRKEDGALLLTVEDTGIGMSADELAALGARFTEIQGAGVRGADGAGLGLSLAFALAERHGGSLDIQSAPGEGVRARVRLPIVTSPSRNETAAAPGEALRIQSQLERVEAYRREVGRSRAAEKANAA